MEPRLSTEFNRDFWPAPLALVSVGIDAPNIFTLSVLGAPCSVPPMLTISCKPTGYSYQLLKEIGQFVVNVPTVHMIDELEYCGIYSGRDVDKWERCGFTPAKGTTVEVPLIAECPVNLECRLEREIRFTRPDGKEGTHVLVIGRIVHLNCHEKYYIDGHVQWDLIDVIIRARPRTWRALGPVVGYDTRKGAPSDPRLAAEVVNRRTADLADILEPERELPPRSGVT